MESSHWDKTMHLPSGGGGEGWVWIPNPETSPSSPPNSQPHIPSPCETSSHPTSLFLSWPLTWLFEGGGGWAGNCLKFLKEMQAFPSSFKKS